MTSPVERITEALWAAFKAADNCFVDEAMDVIDTGGNYMAFRMEQVAAHLIQALGLTVETRTAFIGVGRFPDPIHPKNYQDQQRWVSPWVGLQP